MIIAGAMSAFFLIGVLWTKGASRVMMGVMGAAMAAVALTLKGG